MVPDSQVPHTAPGVLLEAGTQVQPHVFSAFKQNSENLPLILVLCYGQSQSIPISFNILKHTISAVTSRIELVIIFITNRKVVQNLQGINDHQVINQY